MWIGLLPEEFDFQEVEGRIEQAGILGGVLDACERTIEFYPARANVYKDMRDLLRVAANRRLVPARFTVTSLDFTYPDDQEEKGVPADIAGYIQAVRLWSVLEGLADVTNSSLLFISSHNSQVELVPELECEGLQVLPDFSAFVAEFSNPTTHVDQKRAIVRSTLIEQFKPRRSVTMAEVLRSFSSIATHAKQSFALYMEEFSLAKIKAEVERKNLDDTLSLNKAIADIQNQLLGLPAAILLAGATIKNGEIFRNSAVLLGVWVFCVFIWLLASNQRNSVNAIQTHIEARKRKLEKMPAESRDEVLAMFASLDARVTRQLATLSAICIVVLVVALLSSFAVYLANTL